MLLTKRTDFDGVADNSYIGRHALNTSTDWQAFTGGFIDDAGVCSNSTINLPVPLLMHCLVGRPGHLDHG
jgi:hypothetical protein